MPAHAQSPAGVAVSHASNEPAAGNHERGDQRRESRAIGELCDAQAGRAGAFHDCRADAATRGPDEALSRPRVHGAARTNDVVTRVDVTREGRWNASVGLFRWAYQFCTFPLPSPFPDDDFHDYTCA